MNVDDRNSEGSDAESCGHPACSCTAGPSGYCSPTCEAQADSDEGDHAECACGHADCGGAGELSETGS